MSIKEEVELEAKLNLDADQHNAIKQLAPLIDRAVTEKLALGEFTIEDDEDALLREVVEEQLDAFITGHGDKSLLPLIENQYEDLFALLSYGFETTAELVAEWEASQEPDEF